MESNPQDEWGLLSSDKRKEDFLTSSFIMQYNHIEREKETKKNDFYAQKRRRSNRTGKCGFILVARCKRWVWKRWISEMASWALSQLFGDVAFFHGNRQGFPKLRCNLDLVTLCTERMIKKKDSGQNDTEYEAICIKREFIEVFKCFFFNTRKLSSKRSRSLQDLRRLLETLTSRLSDPQDFWHSARVWLCVWTTPLVIIEL